MADKLTKKQEAFCLAYAANGGNASKAYRDVYNSKSDEGARAGGHENLTKPHIIERIRELDEKTTVRKILSIEERKEILSEMATDPDASRRDRQNAIEILNKMGQVYIQRQEVNVSAVPVVIKDDI